MGLELCLEALLAQCLRLPVPAQLNWSMEPNSLPDPGIPAGNSSSVAQEKFRVLVGVTGSVAALKLPLLVAELLKIPGVSEAGGGALSRWSYPCFEERTRGFC